jgi:hypothetical protein
MNGMVAIGMMIAGGTMLAFSALWIYVAGTLDAYHARMMDKIIALVEQHGFRSRGEAVACLEAIRRGEYKTVIDLLTHGR